jgi:hypothetical protein
VIDKCLGDGILASFGAVTPSITFAADLCRAIDELATTAEHWRLEQEGHGWPAPGVGLAGAVGDVVFGIVGHATRLEYTVIGEVVNLVAKLEKRCRRVREPGRLPYRFRLTRLTSHRGFRYFYEFSRFHVVDITVYRNFRISLGTSGCGPPSAGPNGTVRYTLGSGTDS